MRRLLLILGVAAASLALAAPAQAIDGTDARNVLQGQAPWVGYHGGDNDIRRAWDWYENTYGINLTSSHIYTWWRVSGNHHVGVGWVFYRANGQQIKHAFSVWDGRSWGVPLQDESWYRIS